jgi:outer membrane lipoprotein SlyB
MKKVMLALAMTAGLAGCTTAEKGAVGGAAIGAIAGQAIGGNTESTLAGAAIGGVSGYLIGRSIDNRPGYCQQYDRRTGRAVGRPYRC